MGHNQAQLTNICLAHIPGGRLELPLLGYRPSFLAVGRSRQTFIYIAEEQPPNIYHHVIEILSLHRMDPIYDAKSQNLPDPFEHSIYVRYKSSQKSRKYVFLAFLFSDTGRGIRTHQILLGSRGLSPLHKPFCYPGKYLGASKPRWSSSLIRQVIPSYAEGGIRTLMGLRPLPPEDRAYTISPLRLIGTEGFEPSLYAV